MVGEPGEKKEANPEAKEHWRKGNSLFEASKFSEAIAEFTEAIRIDPEYSDAYFNRALAERISHDYNSAKADLQKVMELEPKSPDAPLLYGDMAEASNDLVGAKYWYEKSLSIDPNYSEAKNRLEHIDSLMHVDLSGTGPGPSTGGQLQKQVQKQEEETEVIEEGQIKKLAFYKSNTKFDAVIGLNKVKTYLHDNVVLAIQHPELFKKYGKELGLGLLLYGPPGTGKTHTVNAIAGEAGANVIVAQINQIVDMYTGNTEKNLHAIFEQARKNPPCIIFFDELDALGVKRGGGGGGDNNSSMRLAVNQFLVEMNGVQANPEGIFVIGATNQPWDIDPALKRSGRFGDSVYIAPPNYRDRKALFDLYTKNKPRAGLRYGRLSRATMGYSPADIKRICDKAAMRPLLHEYQYKKERMLTMADMMAVLKDKDSSGSSLDEWYSMVKKDVISKTETQIVDGKKQEIVKEGKLDAQEKILYKAMVKDIKKNTSPTRIRIKKLMRWFAVHFF
ncbi:MAG: AAA family ATPase [Candidatus Marsarchaeota archaeon]|nr:AAA family ATPase [Candidatus Marsarchaeota archaeon]